MKKVLFLGLLLPAFAWAQGAIFEQVYGPWKTACTQTTLTTAGTAYRTVALTAYVGKRVLLYGHDNAGNGSAIKCLQGGSTVDASSLTGCATGGTCTPVVIFAGQKEFWKIVSGGDYISCVAYANSQKFDVCPSY